MQRSLVSLLACPSCQGPLDIDSQEEQIVEASLFCPICPARYPVRGGIPRLLPKAVLPREIETARHFTEEFGLDPTVDDRQSRVDEFVFFTRAGFDKTTSSDYYPTSLAAGEYVPDYSAFDGATVIDAGCGSGRFCRIAAKSAALVIGLELGAHVEQAAAQCAQVDNVEFVQGSVLDPPLQPQIADLVYSLGVLHHTVSPEAGVHALARLVRADGRLAVWVYPPTYWGRRGQATMSRAVHAFVSRLAPRPRLWVLRNALMPLGHLQARVAAMRWGRVLAAPLFLVTIPRHPDREVMLATIADKFGPKIISTHDHPEVVRWFENAGLEDIEVLPVPTSVSGRRNR